MSLHARELMNLRVQEVIRNYPKLFDATVDRLLNSPNPEEREWVFLGFSQDGQHAVFLPVADLVRNGHLVGDPGSGKTAKGLNPLISQLIAGGLVSVVIFDLKGDMGMFQNARWEAERAGVPFKYFTMRIGWGSHVWNFFSEPVLARMSYEQIGQTIIGGTGLDHGEIYGGGHYTAANRIHEVNILDRYGESIHSFADLYQYCSDPNAYRGVGLKEDAKDARHLINVLRMLAGILPLNATPAVLPGGASSCALRHAMSVEELLSSPAVYYFWLPATVDSNQATCITRLMLYAEIVAAGIYQQERKTQRVINIIDEAQLVATQGLPLVLNQARGLGIGCILAHQSLDQLKLNSDNDLTQIVLSSTAFKQVFRATDLLIRDYLTRSGGEALYHKTGWTQPVPVRDGDIEESALKPVAALQRDAFSGNPILSVGEQSGPRLQINRIMEVSASPHLSLVSFTEDHGPVQYQGAWSTLVSGFHIDAETYAQRMNTPWPPANEEQGTIVVPRNWKSGPVSPAPAPVPPLKTDLQERVQKALADRLKQTR